MPGRASIAQWGDYNNPQVLNVGNLSPTLTPLGQWWFDFSRIAEAHVSLSIGVEMEIFSGGVFFPIFGIFLLPDGDVNPADLFNVINPDLQVIMLPLGPGFHGFEAHVTIPNPATKRQVLLAHTWGTTGTSGLGPTVYKWRSMLLDAQGV